MTARPHRHSPSLAADARAVSLALAELDHDFTAYVLPPPEHLSMATQKAKKTKAAAVPGAPDPAIVQQVKDGMMAQLAASPPVGAQAALFDGSGKGAAKLKKLIGELAPVLVKVVLAGRDGVFSPGEVAGLVDDAVALVTKLLAKGDDAQAPATAPTPPPPAPRVA